MEPRWLTPTTAMLSMVDGAKGRVSPEIGARRSFLRAAAAERGPRTAVPPRLRDVYVSWVRTTIAARHGRASDVHLGLHAFVLAHSLGLSSTRAPLSKTRPASQAGATVPSGFNTHTHTHTHTHTQAHARGLLRARVRRGRRDLMPRGGRAALVS